jgi:hypothetical protein
MLRGFLIASTGIILILFGLVLFWSPASNFQTVPLLGNGDLSSFDRIHRLVIVFPGDDTKERAFFGQWLVPSMPKRMSYRSLLLYRVADPKIVGQLRSHLSPGETGFHIWLIGTGGKLLLTTTENVEPWQIFARIDSLPGRRDEIRRYNEWVSGHDSSP